MANLDAILKYQEVDIKLRKTLDEIERSDSGKRLEQSRKGFNEAKAMVEDSERTAGEVADFYRKAIKFYNEYAPKIEEYEQRLKGELTDEERKKAVTALETLKSKFSEIEKRLSERKNKGDKLLDEYREGQKRGKKMREVHAEAKESHENLKREKEPVIAEFKKTLETLRPSVDKEIMTMYDELASERKYPAFVEAYGDEKSSFSCRGCGLQLSQSSKGQLLEKGVCRCDTCRRIIYLPEKKKKK